MADHKIDIDALVGSLTEEVAQKAKEIALLKGQLVAFLKEHESKAAQDKEQDSTPETTQPQADLLPSA